MAARALLDGKPRPTDDEIHTALEGNICRCTGYSSIVESVHLAAGQERP
jgi:carbon-monoxide dehydrogenase small subunit